MILFSDLNELLQRENSGIVCLKGSVYSKKPFEVQVLPNFAEHEFVSGPRYQLPDVKMKWISQLGRKSSGVALMAVNNGCIKLFKNPMYNSFLRKYEIQGKFGMATRSFMADDKVIERSTCKHVKQSSLDLVLASIQASHQKTMYSGIDLQSQEAYELASSGLVRPPKKSGPVIYSMKCTKFSLPEFTLEVHCINETESYLAELIHDIGIDLRTNAVCTHLRRTQYGHFTLSHALLRKHWTLENVINNLTLCQTVLEEVPDCTDLHHIQQSKQQDVIEAMQRTVRDEYI